MGWLVTSVITPRGLPRMVRHRVLGLSRRVGNVFGRPRPAERIFGRLQKEIKYRADQRWKAVFWETDRCTVEGPYESAVVQLSFAKNGFPFLVVRGKTPSIAQISGGNQFFLEEKMLRKEF